MDVKVTSLTALILVMVQCYCTTSMPLSKSEGMIITPDNIKYHATYLHPSTTIEGRVIHFVNTEADQKLLEVPIMSMDPHASIVVTVGLDASHPNTPGVDSDPRFGISDGSDMNEFFVIDRNTPATNPCFPVDGDHNGGDTSNTFLVSPVNKFTFVPFDQYGVCESVAGGVRINTARFGSQLDTTKPLFLTIISDDEVPEEYFIYYIKVEIFP